MYSVTLASEDDKKQILKWLEESDSGFLSNFESTIDPDEPKGHVYVCKPKDDSSKVLGFLAGRFNKDASMDIMEVREEYQKKGVGTSLANHCLQLLVDASAMGVLILCAPETSQTFWARFGFEHINSQSYRDEVCMVKTFNRSRPIEKRDAKIRIEFPNKRHTWPKGVFETDAELIGGEYLLENEFIGFAEDPDTIVNVHFNDELVWNWKVKYLVEKLGGERNRPFVSFWEFFEDSLDDGRNEVKKSR